MVKYHGDEVIITWLSKEVNSQALVSKRFKENLKNSNYSCIDHGEHIMKGLDAPIQLFTAQKKK